MKKFFGGIYIEPRFYIALAVNIAMFVFGYYYQFMINAGVVVFIVITAVLLSELAILFFTGNGVQADRIMEDKLSNGDPNPIAIKVSSKYGVDIFAVIIDELPAQFQERNFSLQAKLKPGETKTLAYSLRPVERGEYRFGFINVFARTAVGFASRRYRFGESRTVAVFPSYIQMKQYSLAAITNRVSDPGIKQTRKIGHTMEFEQIRQYVRGDDYRTVNWKATARRSQIMVNEYRDEISQQVYSVIDMGRTMKMPFEGMTLLDYAINSALVISNIAVQKYDKPGLITFSEKVDTVVPADRKPGQMYKILNALYSQQTRFLEPNWEMLLNTLRWNVRQRSLLLLFTNFETLAGMKRSIQYIKHISKFHLPVVIFFRNTELYSVIDRDAGSVKGIYSKIIAEKIAYEKVNIVKELNKYGIMSIYTAPENLTVNTINKYLEIKSRRLL